MRRSAPGEKLPWPRRRLTGKDHVPHIQEVAYTVAGVPASVQFEETVDIAKVTAFATQVARNATVATVTTTKKAGH